MAATTATTATAPSARSRGSDRGSLTQTAARIGLALVAAGQAEIGIWGVIAPRSFFDTFPGQGHHWVSSIPPFNEHLVRDYAGTELGFALLLLAAAVWFERRLVFVAGVAFVAGTLPHFVYHLTTTARFSTFDNLASLGAFVLELAVVVLAMVAAGRVGLFDPPNPRYRHPNPRPGDF